MAYRTNRSHKDSKTVDAGLSAYEEAMVKKILKQKEAEQDQALPANDSDTLRYLFTIFH